MLLLKSLDGRYFQLDARQAERFRVTRRQAKEILDGRQEEEPIKLYGWNWPNWHNLWSNGWSNW